MLTALSHWSLRRVASQSPPRCRPTAIAARGISATLHSELRRRGGSICTPAIIGRCQRRRPVSPALAATNQAGISTRAPPTTERYWFTTPGHNVSFEVQHCQFGSLTVHVWLPPNVLVKVGRQHFFGGANVQPSYENDA